MLPFTSYKGKEIYCNYMTSSKTHFRRYENIQIRDLYRQFGSGSRRAKSTGIHADPDPEVLHNEGSLKNDGTFRTLLFGTFHICILYTVNAPLH